MRIRRLALRACAVLIVGVFFSPLSRGATLEVIPGSALPTVGQAIARAGTGDTLIVATGTYNEFNLKIDRRLTLIGNGHAVIDGRGAGEVISVTADSVIIRGLTIRGAGVSFIDDNAGLRLEGVRGCVVEDCRFEDNFFGIYLAKSADCRIAHNAIRSTAATETRAGNGIHLWYCRDVTVDSNDVSGHRDGVYFEFVYSSDIIGNESYKNLRYGLHFMFSDSCLYAHNSFVENGAGVAVMYTRHVTMEHNVFQDNWGASSYGLLLKDITDSKVCDNLFYRNTVGIHIEGSSRVHIASNSIVENGWGIRLLASAIDNTITRNNFIENSLAVATNSRSSFSTFDHNYWSEYRGYDLDRDGRGDQPFRPVGLYSLVVERHPPALILLRSLLVNLLNAAERVLPTLTPATLADGSPAMRPFP